MSSTAAYMRDWRARNTAAVERNRAGLRAIGRAHRRLASLHADEFAILLAEERAKEGLAEQGTAETGAPSRHPLRRSAS